MAVGGWVFPIGMVAFIGYLAVFLAGNPATPASFLVVEAGDTIVYEETAFYGDGTVAWTTREDLLESDGLRVGPYGVVPKPRQLQLTLPEDEANVTDPLLKELIGKRANETIRTEPRDNYYATFDESITINRTIANLPTVVTVRTGQTVAGRTFNASEFVRSQEQRLGHPLQVGDEVPCDFGNCRIESFDAQQVTYRHLIVDGATYPLDRFIFFPDQEPKPQSRFQLDSLGADRFAILLDTVEGDAFVLRSSFGSFPPGYYRFGERTDGDVLVHYRGTEVYTSEGNLVPAHLIGERVWFELKITQIK